MWVVHTSGPSVFAVAVFFKIIFDLQKSCKDSTEFCYTQLAVMINNMITFCITIVIKARELTLVQYH